MEDFVNKHLDAMTEGLMGGVENQPLKKTEHQNYETGAKRGSAANRGRYDLISHIFLRRLAIHLEKGADNYAPRNWEKGLPLHRSFESMIRHAYQWIAGETDEDHLAAVACNIMFIIHTERLIEEGELPTDLLEDLPDRYLCSRRYLRDKDDNIQKDKSIEDKFMEAMAFTAKFSQQDPSVIERLLSEKNPIAAKMSTVGPRQTINPETQMFERGKRDKMAGLEPAYENDQFYMNGYQA